jgi:hypothetical protein
MPRWLALGLLVVIPGAQACQAVAALSFEFPADPACTRQTPTGCPPLPQADDPVVFDGVLVWSWEAESCSLDLATSPVHISFEALERHNHGWLALTVSPREIVIPVQDQWDVTDDDVDPATGAFRAEERYPVQVSIALVGEPSREALASLAASDGAATMLLKASSSRATGVLESFAIASFRLDGTEVLPESSSRGLPAPSFGPLLAGLGLAILARRSRAESRQVS